MGLQIVVRAKTAKDVEIALGAILVELELFPITDGQFGLSISTKNLDSLGEDFILSILANVEYYDLWSGNWRKPANPSRKKSKFW